MEDAQVKAALRELGAKVEAAREVKGWKQEVLASKVGVTQTSISRIENGKAGPGEELLMDLASVLDLDVDELRFILAPTQVPEAYRKFVRIERAADFMAATAIGRRSRKDGYFPIVGMSHAGEMVEAIENDESPEGEIRVTPAWAEAAAIAGKSKFAFVVEVEGESMLPTIQPGDELLVDPKAKLENGSIALVQLAGKTSVRRYRKVGGMILLTPDNPDRKAHPEKDYTEGQFAELNGRAYRVVLARTTRRL